MVSGGKTPHLNIFQKKRVYRDHKIREERKSRHSPTWSLSNAVLRRWDQRIRSSRMALIVPLASISRLWKTFLFLASQIFQRMKRGIKGRIERGKAYGKEVVNISVIGLNCGLMPVAHQIRRAAGGKWRTNTPGTRQHCCTLVKYHRWGCASCADSS